MTGTKCATGLLAVAAAVVSAGVFAQAVTQTVTTSSTSVSSNGQFKAMPRSTVTVRTDPWANPGTSTTRVIESTRSAGGPRPGAAPTQWRVVSATPAGRSGPATATVAAVTTRTTGVQDRNPDSPGKGWAKGKTKQKHKNKHKHD